MRITVKVGTSTLAHATGRLNIQRMEALCKVLSDLKNAGHEIILVSSGAIGMGVGKLNLPGRPADMPTKQAAAAVGQCELMYTYDKLFNEYNHTVAQVLLTGEDVRSEQRSRNMRNTIFRLLELGALPIINENKLVTICTGSNPDISAANQTYGFRIEPTDLQQAVYAADWMVEDGRSKVAILYESTDYGMGQEEIISQILKESGAEIVCSEAYVLGETKDFTNILTKVKNSGADSIFLAGTYTEGALIVKQQKSLGMTLPCYSSSSMFEVAFLEAAGDPAEGVKVQGVLVPDDPSEVIVNFQNKYKELYGDDKTAGTFSGHGYASVMMLAEAMNAVGTDPDAMAEYLASKDSFDTVYGKVYFNETHDLMFEKLTRLVVQDGKFVVVD